MSIASGEVDQAVTSGFRTGSSYRQRRVPFTGEDAGAVVGELAHHSGHKSDFATADTDYRPAGTSVSGPRWRLSSVLSAGGNASLRHRSCLWDRNRCRLSAAHRQSGQGVFEGLLRSQGFENRQVNRRVKRIPPLYGPMAELNCTRHARLTGPDCGRPPHHSELDHARSGSHQTFQQSKLTMARISLKGRPQGGHHLPDGLSKFGLMRIALLNARVESLPECTSRSLGLSSPYGCGCMYLL